jgi:hypothetical protein
MLMLAALTSWGPAASAAGPKEPFLIGWEQIWSGEPIAVPSGTPLLFQVKWVFATEALGVTEPPDYLDQVLGGGMVLTTSIDGKPLVYKTSVKEQSDVCGISADGTELCQDATIVTWEALTRPPATGWHTVDLSLAFLKDFPNDGWGWSGLAGDKPSVSNTIGVGVGSANIIVSNGDGSSPAGAEFTLYRGEDTTGDILGTCIVDATGQCGVIPSFPKLVYGTYTVDETVLPGNVDKDPSLPMTFALDLRENKTLTFTNEIGSAETYHMHIYVCTEGDDAMLYPSYWGVQYPVGAWPLGHPTISHDEAVEQFQGAGLSPEDAEAAARALCRLWGSPPEGGGSDTEITLDQTPVWGELWIPPTPATYPPIDMTSIGP